MSIPLKFNPIGISPVKELPYIPPLLEPDPSLSIWGNGIPSNIRPYTFKMWSKAFSAMAVSSYKYFDGDYDASSAIFGTQHFRLIFEYPVKIAGFTVYVAENYGYVTLYRVDKEGNRIQVAKSPKINANTAVSIDADNKVFCTEYVFELYGPNTYLPIREIELNAFYRPSDL